MAMTEGANSELFTPEQIGRRLQATREAIGVNQAEFAQQLGMANQTYNHYETGRRMLPPHWAVKIAVKFGVTTDWLYMGDASGLPYRMHDKVLSKLREM